MRLSQRRAQCVASLFAVAVIGGLGLACSAPSSQPLASGPAPTTIVIGSDPAPHGDVVPIGDAELELRAQPATSIEESTSSSASDSSSTTEPETSMAPSTGSTKRSSTPVTVSSKAPPTGPGVPPIPQYTMSPDEQDFFACVVMRESSGNPGAINWSSGAAGLFQFMPSTWDATARHVGRYDLVGVNPALAPSDLQWWFAHELFTWQGPGPWASDGCRYGGRTNTTMSRFSTLPPPLTTPEPDPTPSHRSSTTTTLEPTSTTTQP